jgi:hypothetical protein
MRWRMATHADPGALTLLGASCIDTYSGQSVAEFGENGVNGYKKTAQKMDHT